MTDYEQASVLFKLLYLIVLVGIMIALARIGADLGTIAAPPVQHAVKP